MADLDRRHFLTSATATVAAGHLGLVALSERLDAMTTVRTRAAPSTAAGNDVRPFRVSIPQAKVSELRRRINATLWPESEQVADDSQGVQLATMTKLAAYWGGEYDWRRVERRINAVPNFITTIDGLDIHFIHVKSRERNAMPLIITHGWPGSFIEQMKIIDPLVDPVAHGGRAEDAFDVVIPSLPGYGFSGKPTAIGWHPQRIATAWMALMRRLGYTAFVAQGGDWGNAISELMALQSAPELLGISTNMPAAVAPDISKAIFAGSLPPATLAPDERNAWAQLAHFYGKGLSYASEMALRPQTLYGLADSPVGLAAWMLDHDTRSYALIRRVFDGESEGLTRDDVLDNITLYWLTNSAISSARLYWNSSQLSQAGFFDPRNVQIPVAVTVFPDEIYAAPRTWVERAYPKLIYFNTLPKGGHFAAWEQPTSFAREMRESFRPLRTATQ